MRRSAPVRDVLTTARRFGVGLPGGSLSSRSTAARADGARRRLAVGLGGVLLLALLAGCVSAPPPPTMDEVFDGQATAQARSAAIESLDRWADGFAVPGLSEVARKQFLTCREGQNNWKVHDGYRLKCEAHHAVYLAWDGDFHQGAKSVLESLRRVCTISGFDEVPKAPADDLIQFGPQGTCVGGVWVFTEYGVGDTKRLLVTENISSLSDVVRWVSGPQGEELRSRLKIHQWVVPLDVSSVFYQDAA